MCEIRTENEEGLGSSNELLITIRRACCIGLGLISHSLEIKLE
jgi:hypothetical protein